MPSRKPAQRLEDIIYNIEAINRYASGLDESGFIANALVIDAVERCLSRIAESAAKLGALAPQLMPDQPWHSIRGLGNRLRHDYDVSCPAKNPPGRMTSHYLLCGIESTVGE